MWDSLIASKIPKKWQFTRVSHPKKHDFENVNVCRIFTNLYPFQFPVSVLLTKFPVTLQDKWRQNLMTKMIWQTEWWSTFTDSYHTSSSTVWY